MLLFHRRIVFYINIYVQTKYLINKLLYLNWSRHKQTLQKFWQTFSTATVLNEPDKTNNFCQKPLTDNLKPRQHGAPLTNTFTCLLRGLRRLVLRLLVGRLLVLVGGLLQRRLLMGLLLRGLLLLLRVLESLLSSGSFLRLLLLMVLRHIEGRVDGLERGGYSRAPSHGGWLHKAKTEVTSTITLNKHIISDM